MAGLAGGHPCSFLTCYASHTKFRTGSEHRLLALQFAFEAFFNCAARIAQKSRSFCAEPLL
jgi:hypothetical protein